jgi:protein SCO1/2
VPGAARPVAATVASAILLAGCAGTEGISESGDAAIVVGDEGENSRFHGTLVDPPIERPDLTLADTSGNAFSLSARPDDEVTVVFFGYTHCPDLCPTTMADLAQARRQLPPAVRDRVTVVFVSEDPERDTPAVLRDWLDGMDPELVGLIGGNTKTEQALRDLYLPPSRPVPTPQQPVIHPEDGHDHPGEYGVDHPGIVYAFGGGASVIYTGGTTPSQYAEDFTRLAGQSSRP